MAKDGGEIVEDMRNLLAMMEMFYVLIRAVATCVYILVKTH